jgi:hypothetical protein
MSTTKRPPLTSLMRPPAEGESQQLQQAAKDALLHGFPMPPALTDSAVPQLPSPVSARPVGEEPAAPGLASEDGWVDFASYLKRSTYLLLKQAEFWEPGFQIRDFLDKSLRQALLDLPNANRELPPPQLDKLLKKNRKLRG